MGSMKNKAMEAEAQADYETRVSVKMMEVEKREDKPTRLVGYAAVFNQATELYPGYFERIANGAFTRTLKEGADVRALVDHDPSKIIGRSTADPATLDLEENAKGLKVSITPPDTQVGRDIVESVSRGDVDQMSFAFRTVAYEWEEKGDTATRTLTDVDLFDVSIVTYPAYPQTSVAVRCLERQRAGNPPKPTHDYSDVEARIDALRKRAR